jgi:hypothetical protein
VATNGPHINKYLDLWPQTAYKSSMKTDILKVRLTATEKEGFQEAAKLAGIAVSAWARERLRRAAIRELEDASRDIPFLEKDRGE